MAISVLPSVASLRELRDKAGRSAAAKPFVGFGDPIFAGAAGNTRGVAAAADFCREGQSADLEVLKDLPRLRETAGELADIARTLGAGRESVILGVDASESRVRSMALDEYRVVAFATHGLLPSEIRCQSEPALVLTPPATAGPQDDGLLDASEVAQLKLDADWVLLSACNTARADGKLGGESLSGLAQGFFYAGARALVASHWAVASRPTVQLTTGMFGVYTREPAVRPRRGAAARRSWRWPPTRTPRIPSSGRPSCSWATAAPPRREGTRLSRPGERARCRGLAAVLEGAARLPGVPDRARGARRRGILERDHRPLADGRRRPPTRARDSTASAPGSITWPSASSGGRTWTASAASSSTRAGSPRCTVPPRDFPEYSPGYYAVFFEDPDRLKLEVAHVPPRG